MRWGGFGFPALKIAGYQVLVLEAGTSLPKEAQVEMLHSGVGTLAGRPPGGLGGTGRFARILSSPAPPSGRKSKRQPGTISMYMFLNCPKILEECGLNLKADFSSHSLFLN